MEKPMRTVRLQPYFKGADRPTFSLYLFETNKSDSRGCSYIRYRFVQHTNGCSETIFEGDDFSAGPLHSIDGNEAVKGLLGFLTLRPGDTDKEYFDSYTIEQLEFTEQHAESLSCEVLNRFGE